MTPAGPLSQMIPQPGPEMKGGGGDCERGSQRILMVHWDGAGNLPPQRALARELVRRGHEVHALTHDSIRPLIEADGTAFHRFAVAPQISAVHGVPPAAERAWLAENVLACPGYGADLLEVSARVRPSVTIVDGMLLTALHAAAGSRTPWIAAIHSIFARSLQDRFDGLWQSISGSPEAGFSDFLQRAPLALVFSYREFADPIPLASTIEHVGPIREASGEVRSPRRFEGRPFVLVSLSTGFQDQRGMIQAICNAMAELPVEALVTTGPGVNPVDVQAPANVSVVSHAPHDSVLPHVDLVVTHGGHGTVAAAVGAGVPLLCLPMGRDQPAVAARVADLGLGRTVAATAGTGTIAQAVKEMIADRAQRRRSRAFADRVPRFGDVQRAADLVERRGTPGP